METEQQEKGSRSSVAKSESDHVRKNIYMLLLLLCLDARNGITHPDKPEVGV